MESTREIVKRDYYFDTLKGVLILLVVIGNSLELSKTDLPFMHYFILFLYMFHMPLFAFISGYFCKQSKRSTVQRVSEIFILYVSVQTLYFMFYKFIMGETEYRLKFMEPYWTLWYLVSLIFWYIIYDYIKDYKKWLIGSLLVAILIGYDPSVFNYLSISRTIFFLPFFILGVIFKKEYIKKIKEKKKLLGILSLIVLIILFFLSFGLIIDLLFEFVGYESYYPNATWYPLLIRIFHYIGAVILGAFIMSLIPKNKTMFSSIGKYSLYIYIVHSGVSEFFITNEILKYYNYGFLIFSEIVIVFISLLLVYLYVKFKDKILIKKATALKN
ncbi:acyltransferase family protein [Clostridium sp. LY3-2]|uniref:acyltransferase family protein n=1 Tax=Clostridium sp. LY3-2 TaxID=2942482 RepID=UPI0021532BF5|nr:acyltransferase family protein [Clostridium sp. LY3-2]MCR6515116.1 acyltransferase family protein [Clostridium sp. LY3-2]